MHMVKRRIFFILSGLAVLALIAFAAGGSFLFGYRLGSEHPQTLVVEGVKNINPEAPLQGDFGVFWQAWQLINEKFLNNKEVSDQEKVYGAVRGLVGALDDPYAEFFDPEDNQKFQEDIKGHFGGIGAEIGIRDEQLIIVTPLADTPAMRAGLRPSDKIVRVDGESTAGITVQEAIKRIRGIQGTKVVLDILRDGWDKTREFRIIRADITAPTLSFEMKNDIGYVHLQSFNDNTARLLRDAVSDMRRNNARGMVLDLRNNPGGFLNVAIDVSGWFLNRGTLVVKKEGTGENEQFFANGNELLAKFPVVIVINKGSASASEILAGALHDQRNVKLVGETSFGKGTVQELENLKDGSSLKVTTAHWVLPSGKILEGEGIPPDVEVALTEEDVKNKKDPQLEKALEILGGEIAKLGS
ncbi:MAG: S41 family peptidase [Candidatus Liptonbacteria bacterium]|nr:S41 family peptidase [Candidatus Liptonbacteria bacterium]